VITATLAIMMADLGAALTGARPVPAGCVSGITRESRAVQLRPSQNVMAVGLVTSAIDHLALFGDGCLLSQIVLVSVQICDAFGDTDPFGVVPGALTDPVASIDGWLTAGSAGTEIGMPCPVARSCRGSQILTMLVGSCQATEFGSSARARARDEETHRVLRKLHVRAEKKEQDDDKKG